MTRVYKYGLLPPEVGAELVDEQIFFAHRYYNQLVEIERDRRYAADAAIACDELKALITSSEIEEDKTKRKELYAEIKRIRKLRLSDPTVKAAIEKGTNDAKILAKKARAESALYWGTYLIIEDAIQAAKGSMAEPKFRRWQREGAVAVELQKGLAVTECVDGTDRRLRIDTELAPIEGRKGKPRPRLWIRVGSDGRAPVWAVFPLIYHRPLPPDGLIKWAKVIRTYTASTPRWHVHITVDEPEIEIDDPNNAPVALDLGWRMVGEEVRAGGYCDGKTDHDIMIPETILGAFEKVESLRSIRDQRLNQLRDDLCRWRGLMPESHKERCSNAGQWKSPARFAALAIWWRDNRYDGDTEKFEAIEAWRKKDKHLWLWEAHARKKAIRRRRDLFRVVAAQLVRKYSSLVVESIKLSRLAKKDDDGQNQRARYQRTCAAPSELRSACINAFRREGKPIIQVPACGPQARDVWEKYREQGGDEIAKGPARSKKFKRLRGILDNEEPPKQA